MRGESEYHIVAAVLFILLGLYIYCCSRKKVFITSLYWYQQTSMVIHSNQPTHFIINAVLSYHNSVKASIIV